MKKTPTTYSAVKSRNFAKTYFDLLIFNNHRSNPYSDVKILSGMMKADRAEKYRKHLIDAGFTLEQKPWSNVPHYQHADGAVIYIGATKDSDGLVTINFHGAKKAKKSSIPYYD